MSASQIRTVAVGSRGRLSDEQYVGFVTHLDQLHMHIFPVFDYSLLEAVCCSYLHHQCHCVACRLCTDPVWCKSVCLVEQDRTAVSSFQPSAEKLIIIMFDSRRPASALLLDRAVQRTIRVHANGDATKTEFLHI